MLCATNAQVMLLFGGAASSLASFLLFVTMLAATYTHHVLGEPV